jgi:uncharacterized protein (TIGR02231 family)
MDTKPSAVTVFPDRARVTRTGKLSLEPGLQRVEINNLPLALIPESVRASGKGTAKAKLLGVSTRLDNYLDTPAETALDLEAKIQEISDADSNLAARALVLEKEQKSVDGLGAQSEMFARGLALRNRTPEEQGQLLDFLTRRSQSIQTELLALSRSRREKAKELDRLRRMLQGQQSARPKQRYTAIIEIEVLTAGALEVELTYVVNQASWKPLYDLRLNELSLEVTYLAQVSQNTGEDWPNVAITLSTAEPSLSLEIPELAPWYIAPPAPIYAARSMAKSAAMVPPQAAPAPQPMADMLMAGSAAAEAAPELEEMVVESAQVSTAGASLTYSITNQADIPGNGDPRKVTVASFSLSPDLDYVTAPKLEEVCYRRAKVKNESAFSLLAGSAQLFEGDNYLGATHLDFVAPNQEFELVLGADERLRVNRELRARDVEKAFIMTDRKRIRYSYSIDLENLRDAPQTIYVRDQLPVPRDEQIKVKLEAAEPRPSDHTHLNLLEWKMTLAPGAKPTIHFEFSVEYPRAMDVVGLP